MASFDDEDLPGGSGYMDVASVFLNAAPDMSAGQMLMMKNFSLHDAMMAIEVMDPRMDSGAAREDYPKVSFDPSSRLLPEEVCWIIDRLFAAEMSWHAGNSLPQSVYSCLYVHEIGPGRLWNGGRIENLSQYLKGTDEAFSLLHIVLRAAIYGVLKCCDLAWRELMKGHVLEMEDFNGEKADRYICETIPDFDVVAMLDSAKAWLLSKQTASLHWRAELVARIEFRRAVLNALSSSLPSDRKSFQIALRQARSHLRDIRTFKTPPTPHASSAAHRAFDPAIHRRLISVMPVKIIPLPDQEDAWERYDAFLDGLQEVYELGTCSSILEIKELLDLRACQPPLANRTGIVRSLSKSVLLDSLGQSWANQLLEAMANVPSPVAFQYLPLSLSRGSLPPHLRGSVDKMINEYLVTFFCNRPRQRRRLCNWMSEWAKLVPQLQDLISIQTGPSPVLQRVLLAIEGLRLMGACHVVLSGLELNLHDEDELPFVYWYGEQVHTALLETLGKLQTACQSAPKAVVDYLSSELDWIGLMDKFFKAACTLSVLIARPLQEGGRPREDRNLRRRFKWAFEGSRQAVPSDHQEKPFDFVDPCLPDLDRWHSFRQRLREQTASAPLATCRDMFQKLEEGTRIYRDAALMRRGLLCTEEEGGGGGRGRGEGGEASVSQVTSEIVDVSGTVRERSWALRMNVVRQLQEVAATNVKRLSTLGTSETSRRNLDREDAGEKASGEHFCETEMWKGLRMVNDTQTGSSRWFPTIFPVTPIP